MIAVLVLIAGMAGAVVVDPVGIVDRGLYPDPVLTPGDADPTATVKNLCTPGYTASIRHVTEAMKRQVLDRYGIPWADHAAYEVDHWYSLEIGGSNSLANLWPQRWKPEPGARQKDVVETAAHRAICKGTITIAQAQDAIRNWYEVYKKLKGLAPATTCGDWSVRATDGANCRECVGTFNESFAQCTIGMGARP